MNDIKFGGCPNCGSQNCVAGQCLRNNLRTIKRKDGDGWTLLDDLKELKSGDTFVMFDSPDQQVGGEWVAESEPYCNIDGVWGIVADERTN